MNHYKTLEVDPKASPEVLKAAYRALAKKCSGDDRRMKRLNIAKDVLFDDDLRAEHDHKSVKKGKVIGSYRIMDQIAEGGFGTTYKAEHIGTGCLVCVKHALHISASDEALLLDEARSCWDLRHWGIPAMRDILTMPDNSLALVMSYVPGPTLAEILEKKPYTKGIDAEHVAWITDRCLNILKYLHFSGVVHGDVKPQNIIVQPEDHTVVLVDYGLSAVKPSRKDLAKGYTPLFASPEQEAGKVLLPQSDFYSLAMTMIFALGGDIEHIKVPGTTPDGMCGFIKRLLKREVFSRPDWKKEDLCDTFREIREEDFGRTYSNMLPLKI
jgi:serine/threonine protein kinase